MAKDKLKTINSAGQRANQKIDHLQSKINQFANPELNKIGLIKREPKRNWSRDSIKFQKTLEANKSTVQSKIDSLEKIGQPSIGYCAQLDSLNKVKYDPFRNKTLFSEADSLRSIETSSLTSVYSSKLDSINKLRIENYTKRVETKANTIQERLNQPASKIEEGVNEKLDLMKKEGGPDMGLSSGATIPNVALASNKGLPDTQLNTGNPLSNIGNPLNEQMDNMDGVKDKISDAKQLPQEQLSKVKSIDEIQSAQSKLSEANEITDKVQGYSQDVKNIAAGDLNEVKELPKVAEEQAGKLGMNELKKESGKFDNYKQLIEKAKDPKALQEEALKQAPNLAVDYFAGKEAPLMQAMDKMQKLKKKYSELSSLSEIKMKSSNTMKGRPLVERIIPGISFQIQKSNNVLVDYNPYIGYRFYGKFSAGMGWNERITIGRHVHLSLDDRIYGPRVFADFKIGKGFSVRTDIEKMNTYVPALTSGGYSTDTEYRAWVWSAFIGIKKEYKFFKNVKGNAQFAYNLYDDHDNSPYADRISARFGFELGMKSKVKPK